MAKIVEYKRCLDDWPYVWAIRDWEQLNWQRKTDGTTLCIDDVERIINWQSRLPVEITPYMFLSNAQNAHDIEMLKERGITHVLNVAGTAGMGPLSEYADANITVLNIDADDEEGYQMLSRHYQKCHAFVETARTSGGKCVVHCVAGINRSGVIVAAVMMLNEQQNVLDVVAHCRERRGNEFLSNELFQEELVAMARREGLLGPKPGDEGCRVQGAAGHDCFNN
jgi:predicted protein tyrosine phosphatase